MAKKNLTKKAEKKAVPKKSAVKKEAEREDKKPEEVTRAEREQNKQLIWFFVIILSVFGGLIIMYLYNADSNNPSYGGVEFKRYKEGVVEYYHGKTDINYQGNVQTIFNLYLRHNPKKNNVALNTDDFSLSGHVVISLPPGENKSQQCKEESVIASGNLEQFFYAFPWVENVFGAVNDEEYSNSKNLLFSDCNSTEEYRTVVLVKDSNKNSIEKEGNCYIVNAKDCQYIKSTERLIMGFVAKMNNATL